jgi:hypothetical protein
MKKLLIVATGQLFSGGSIGTAFLSSAALVMSFAFWAATAPVAQAQIRVPAENIQQGDDEDANAGKPGSNKPGKGEGVDKCTVCHNPHNYHEINIPCDQVDKFLGNHPGDFRGPCQVTGVTNR